MSVFFVFYCIFDGCFFFFEASLRSFGRFPGVFDADFGDAEVGTLNTIVNTLGAIPFSDDDDVDLQNGLIRSRVEFQGQNDR